MKPIDVFSMLMLVLSAMLITSQSGLTVLAQDEQSESVFLLRLDDEDIAALRNGEPLTSQIPKHVQFDVVKIIYSPSRTNPDPNIQSPTNSGNNWNEPSVVQQNNTNPRSSNPSSNSGFQNNSNPQGFGNQTNPQGFNNQSPANSGQNQNTFNDGAGVNPSRFNSGNTQFSQQPQSSFGNQEGNLNNTQGSYQNSTVRPRQPSQVPDNAFYGRQSDNGSGTAGNFNNSAGGQSNQGFDNRINGSTPPALYNNQPNSGTYNINDVRQPASNQFSNPADGDTRGHWQQQNSSQGFVNNQSGTPTYSNPQPNLAHQNWQGNTGQYNPIQDSNASGQLFANQSGSPFNQGWAYDQRTNPSIASNQLGYSALRQNPTVGHDVPFIPSQLQSQPLPQRDLSIDQSVDSTSKLPAASIDANPSTTPVAQSVAGQIDANNKHLYFLWFMLLFSVGLNFYLGWISRSFYVRYSELADELRETFSSTL